MFFRPPRLLLPRLRTRSTSCIAGQRLRTGIHYQSRFTGARHYAGYTSASYNVTLNEVLDDIRTSAGLTPDANSPFTNAPLPEPCADDQANLISGQDGSRDPDSWDHPGFDDEELTPVLREIWSRREEALKHRSLFAHGGQVFKWRQSCAAILRSLYWDDGAWQKNPIPFTLRLNAEQKALLELLETGCKDAFRDAWSVLTRLQKRYHWWQLSLWLLYHSPRLIPNFLRATCQGPHQPAFVAVSDCMVFLLKRYPYLVDRALVTECLHPDMWPAYRLPQGAVRGYLEMADRDGVQYAWTLTIKEALPMEPPALLCFMKRFTDFGDIDGALEALQKVQSMADPEWDLHSLPVIHHCCKLLTLDFVVEKGGERNFRILPKLLELGVKPTRDMMNIVVANAYNSGDSLVAHNIVNYMKEQGMEFDSYTYLACLTGAVRLGDREHFKSLLSEIEREEELLHNPWIFSKILHSHFVSTAKRRDFDENPHAAFYSMLNLYSGLHDITPLKDLAIVPPNYIPPLEGLKTPPSVVALYVMIATHLRFWKSVTNVERVYHRFRYFVSQGHETIAPLAATDHTMNEFLVAFRSDPRGLRPAVRLLEDMQTFHSGNGFANPVAQQFKHAPPSVRTWTLLMSCFVYNKEPYAAERVQAMMKKHGVEFNDFTWNMIINNYANSQNIPALARTLKEMEDKGIIADNYTINSLRYLRDPERLWIAIEELNSTISPSSASGSFDSEVKREPAERKQVKGEQVDGEQMERGTAGEGDNSDWLLDQGLQRLKGNKKAKT
ncbi:pentatricopeptide repeat protein [Aspergillus undulatus]|uniref:pentatricopeptide repeat protein n=1 Tax=Aspergillus undulatus TaxID=1810928 RepID=UPI003CCDCF0E